MPQNIFNRLQIMDRRRFKLYIADMAAVGKFMVRPFNAHLVKRADGIANRHMEGICIVRFIGHAGNNAVLLAVDTDKASGNIYRSIHLRAYACIR